MARKRRTWFACVPFVDGGSRTSLFGQFGGNDEVVFEARYSF